MDMKPADFINAFEAGREHEAKAVLMLGPGADSLSPLALRSLAECGIGRSHRPGHATLQHSSQHRAHQFGDSLSAHPDAVCSAGAISAGTGYVSLDAYGGTNGDGRPPLQRPTRTTRCCGRWTKPSQPASRWTRSMPARVPCPSPPMSISVSILALVTGSLFGDIEAKAAVWQRPRGPPIMRRPVPATSPAGSAADVAQMVEAFRLAYANLQEIWSLVLPPQFSAVAQAVLSRRCFGLSHAREPVGAHCVRLSHCLPAAHHQSRTPDGCAHPAISGLGCRPHQRDRIRNRARSATLKQWPRRSRRINPTWSRAGAGPTGSTHDRRLRRRHALAAERREERMRCKTWLKACFKQFKTRRCFRRIARVPCGSTCRMRCTSRFIAC